MVSALILFQKCVIGNHEVPLTRFRAFQRVILVSSFAPAFTATWPQAGFGRHRYEPAHYCLMEHSYGIASAIGVLVCEVGLNGRLVGGIAVIRFVPTVR